MVSGTDDILSQIAKVCVTMQAVCRKHANDPLHVRFNVEGHTNCSNKAERGAASHLELSRYRAKAVCKALKKLGVDKKMLNAQGFGATRPLIDRAGGSTWNQRVEITVADDDDDDGQEGAAQEGAAQEGEAQEGAAQEEAAQQEEAASAQEAAEKARVAETARLEAEAAATQLKAANEAAGAEAAQQVAAAAELRAAHEAAEAKAAQEAAAAAELQAAHEAAEKKSADELAKVMRVEAERVRYRRERQYLKAYLHKVRDQILATIATKDGKVFLANEAKRQKALRKARAIELKAFPKEEQVRAGAENHI